MQRYNVYLISTDTFKAVELIKGGVSGIDSDYIEVMEQKKHRVVDYYVASYEVGSTSDIKSKEELQ